MTSITLIFPHQLFADHPALAPGRAVWLIEDTLFFGDPHCPLKFHKHKLMLHRAAMKAFAARLESQGFTVNYFDYDRDEPIDRLLQRQLSGKQADLHLADPVDYLLERRVKRAARKLNAGITLHDTPMFLTSPAWFNPWQDGRKRYFMADFYKAQRKRLGILVDGDGNPAGGQWSYDAENRKRWPADRAEPPAYLPRPSGVTKEAAHYVEQNFPDNAGTCDTFWFPVTHEQAAHSLRHFLEYRLHGFGDFEDAIARDHVTLHHSVLTPALNCGLLTPRQVVDAALAHAGEHDVPLNDLEGFIRQVIGWREFMRMVYVREGVKQRTSNFWHNTRPLDSTWYAGETGLDPLDHVIRGVNRHAYCHHIERLMVAGNAMLLTRTHPDDVYRWFMELFIDAYDWVMVPNVYGMSQFADGGLITTKPYVSGSNYIRKMSDFRKGRWCETWDGLYWKFIADHRDFFASNHRLSMMTRTLDRMNGERRQTLFQAAEAFLNSRERSARSSGPAAT